MILTCIRCKDSYEWRHWYPYDLCTPCRLTDMSLHVQAVKSSLSRRIDKWARKDLTVEQWIATLNYFGGMCAYCQERDYVFLEHFVPICLGGGTSISNIVPGCWYCNARKRNVHPALVTKIPQEDIDRVRSYLCQFL